MTPEEIKNAVKAAKAEIDQEADNFPEIKAEVNFAYWALAVLAEKLGLSSIEAETVAGVFDHSQVRL